MSASIAVPFNTLLADLDDAIRALLVKEFAGLGFEGMAIAFDAPTREWAAGVSSPTLNLFLYDLRESGDAHASELSERRINGQAVRERPALQLDCAYSITAWTRAVQDEHRMLSQALAILLAHEQLPQAVVSESLAASGPVNTRVGRPKREGAAEFWSALGGQYKLSLDYVVMLPCDPGVQFHRGPPARTQTVEVGDRTASRGSTAELHRTSGVVRHADGRPAPGAWLALPAVAAFATAGPDGRFVFSRVPAGTHECECRTPDGAVARAELTVPGPGLDLTLGG